MHAVKLTQIKNNSCVACAYRVMVVREDSTREAFDISKCSTNFPIASITRYHDRHTLRMNYFFRTFECSVLEKKYVFAR